MDLWIRSQDNHLINFKDNDIHTTQNFFYKNLHDSYVDGTYSIINNDKWLGTYSTKERALEVLDEIQKLLLPYCNCDDVQIKNSAFYQMPKE